MIPSLGHELSCEVEDQELVCACSRCEFREPGIHVTVSGKTVSVQLREEKQPTWIWAALYDTDGKFVTAVKQEVTEEITHLTFDREPTGIIRVFFLTANQTPWLRAALLP